MKPDTRGRTCQHVKTTLIKQIVVPRGVKVRSSPQIIDGVAPTVELSKFHSRCQPGRLTSFVNCPPVVASFLTQRQLSINARWQHMGRVPHPNYVDPECYVATVCHHVRFMYWEHLGHFQRAISHLKWHKIVCMRYLACAFSQMKSTDMFSMYLQSGVPRHFIWWFIAGWT